MAMHRQEAIEVSIEVPVVYITGPVSGFTGVCSGQLFSIVATALKKRTDSIIRKLLNKLKYRDAVRKRNCRHRVRIVLKFVLT